jgi:hypothetical protein
VSDHLLVVGTEFGFRVIRSDLWFGHRNPAFLGLRDSSWWICVFVCFCV